MKRINFFQSKITLSIATLSLVIFLFSSCRSEPTGDQCFENRTDEPMDLYVDGFYEFTLEEGDYSCVFLGNGCFDWYVEGVYSGSYSEGTICLGNGDFTTTVIIEN